LLPPISATVVPLRSDADTFSLHYFLYSRHEPPTPRLHTPSRTFVPIPGNKAVPDVCDMKLKKEQLINLKGKCAWLKQLIPGLHCAKQEICTFIKNPAIEVKSIVKP